MSYLGSNDLDGSSAMRHYYYDLAIELFLDSPIIGVGFSQFQTYSISGLFSHSLYAESISCWGLLGCLIYYPIYVIGIYKSFLIGFTGKRDYRGKMMCGFFAVELFFGVGQVLFYEICHLVLLASFFAWIATYQQSAETEISRIKKVEKRESKYIR